MKFWSEPQVLYGECTTDRFTDKPTSEQHMGNPTCKTSGIPIFWIVAAKSVEILWNHDVSPLHNGIHNLGHF